MNRKRKILLFIIFLSPGFAFSKEKLTSLVPLKVVSVERARVNDRLVRTILYDTDKSAQLDIELIKTPEMTTLIDRRVVKKIDITVSGKREVLSFADSAATSIDNIRIDNGFVKFDVEFFVRVRGGHYLSACTVDVNKDVLPEPTCQMVKQGH